MSRAPASSYGILAGKQSMTATCASQIAMTRLQERKPPSSAIPVGCLSPSLDLNQIQPVPDLDGCSDEMRHTLEPDGARAGHRPCSRWRPGASVLRSRPWKMVVSQFPDLRPSERHP